MLTLPRKSEFKCVASISCDVSYLVLAKWKIVKRKGEVTLRFVWFDRSLPCALLLTKLSRLSISIKNVGVTSGILGTRICFIVKGSSGVNYVTFETTHTKTIVS